MNDDFQTPTGALHGFGAQKKLFEFSVESPDPDSCIAREYGVTQQVWA